MEFAEGDTVEIIGHEMGSHASYHEAAIVLPLPPRQYLVQYRTITDEYGLLQYALVSHLLVHPRAPSYPTYNPSVGDDVDAYTSNGWWTGIVAGIYGELYEVLFVDYDEMTLMCVKDL